MDSALTASLTNPVRLRALDATGLLDDARNDAFERLTRLVRTCLDVPVALVTLVTEDRQVLKGQQGLPDPWRSVGQTALSHSFCQHVVHAEDELRVDDARESPLLCENEAIADLGVVAYLGVPLRTPDGQVLGAVCGIDRAPRAWTDADASVLRDLAGAAEAEVAARYHANRTAGVSRDRQGREAALFRALFARVPAPAYVVDGRGVVLRANPAALGGRPRSGVVGRALAVVAPGAVEGLWEVAGTDVSLALGPRPDPA